MVNDFQLILIIMLSKTHNVNYLFLLLIVKFQTRTTSARYGQYQAYA